MFNKSFTTIQKKEAQQLGRRLIILPIGMLVWGYSLFISDVWKRPYETDLILLGPFRVIWEETSGPGPIPILILISGIIFYLLTITYATRAMKGIMRINVANEALLKIMLMAINIVFILLIIQPIQTSADSIYEIYLEWLAR